MKLVNIIQSGGMRFLVFIFIFLFSWIGFYLSSKWVIGWNVESIDTIYTDSRKAILFEDKNDDTFGIAIYEKYGPFYFKMDMTTSHELVDGEPFTPTGLAVDEGFWIAIKLPPSSNIKYFAVGNHLEEDSTLNDTLTLEDIKNHSSEYTIVPVEGQYVFLLVDDYSEKTWTIRGFDSSGKLIADKFSNSPRYLD